MQVLLATTQMQAQPQHREAARERLPHGKSAKAKPTPQPRDEIRTPKLAAAASTIPSHTAARVMTMTTA
jgi:hypothetical protein